MMLSSIVRIYLGQIRHCTVQKTLLSPVKNMNIHKSYSLSRCLMTPQNCYQFSKLTGRTPHNGVIRFLSSFSKKTSNTKLTIVLYISSASIFMLGLAYASVPLYKIFCQATGFGGQAVAGHDTRLVETMKPVADREIRVQFNADTGSYMRWKFEPQQHSITVRPGETALAFFTAENPTEKPIIGVSTYNVLPFEAGKYLNKIQCFCFEEQILYPHEKVDMPVFFFIDPEYADNPLLENTDEIVLSYTFFESKYGMNLPLPGFMQQKDAQPS